MHAATQWASLFTRARPCKPPPSRPSIWPPTTPSPSGSIRAATSRSIRLWPRVIIRSSGTHRSYYHTLIDPGSTNGTFVNSHRIDRHTLRSGDIVRAGPYRLTYQPGAISQVLPIRQRGRLDALHLTRRVDGGRGEHRTILNDVSLSIAPREFVAIVGGLGTGKTTLLKALSGFEPVEGCVLFNDDDFYDHLDQYRRA